MLEVDSMKSESARQRIMPQQNTFFFRTLDIKNCSNIINNIEFIPQP
jgi:hypothetical protein